MMQFIKYSVIEIKRHRKKLLVMLRVFVVLSLVLVLLSLLFKVDIEEDLPLEPFSKVSVDQNFDGKLYFNDLGDEMIFSREIIKSISSAEETIDIAMYSINYLEIVNLLKEKSATGVKVTLILPKSKWGTHENFFKDTDFKVVNLGEDWISEEFGVGLMHHKFIIVDKNTPNAQLFFGSTNLTKIQERYDPSFAVVTKDKEIIQSFASEFDLLERGVYGVKKLSKKDYKPFAKRIEYLDGYIELWFSPGYKQNSVKYRFINLIENAENSIQILAWQLNDKDIFKALAERARSGIQITILVDDYYMWTNSSVIPDLVRLGKNINGNLSISSDSLKNLMFELGWVESDDTVIGDFNSFLHHHAMIVDGETLVTGTNNWGMAGFNFNDESVVVTNIPSMVGEYSRYFDFLYGKIKKNNVDFTLKDEILTIHGSYPIESKMILYHEKSYPDIVGQKCFEDKLSGGSIKDTYKFLIPSSCITNQTRIFILNPENELLGSEYIR